MNEEKKPWPKNWAGEIMAAASNDGSTIKKKEDTH